MKLHVSACNGHRQVSTTIKKSLYLYEGWNFNSGNYSFTTDTK